jgi:RNA polymerase sigma factor (sigma-70 family)
MVGAATLVLRERRLAFGNEEEVAHNAAVEVWIHRRNYEQEREFWPWFFTIVRNLGVRNSNSHQRVAQGEETLAGACDAKSLKEYTHRDREELRARLLEELANLTKGLSVKERFMVEARFGLGMTQQAIATTVGLKRKAVGRFLIGIQRQISLRYSQDGRDEA